MGQQRYSGARKGDTGSWIHMISDLARREAEGGDQCTCEDGDKGLGCSVSGSLPVGKREI